MITLFVYVDERLSVSPLKKYLVQVLFVKNSYNKSINSSINFLVLDMIKRTKQDNFFFFF